MAKPKLIATSEIRHGYLDGSGALVEVVYKADEPINEELFAEAELDQLRKSGVVKTKKELKEAESEASAAPAAHAEVKAEAPDTTKAKKAK